MIIAALRNAAVVKKHLLAAFLLDGAERWVIALLMCIIVFIVQFWLPLLGYLIGSVFDRRNLMP
jgi:hypothetical protein